MTEPETLTNGHSFPELTRSSRLLWADLARVALGRGAGEPLGASDPTSIAHAIQRHPRDAAYDGAIATTLAALAERLRHDGSVEAAAVRRDISALLIALPDEAVGALLYMNGSATQRREFVTEAADAFATGVLPKLAVLAGYASGHQSTATVARLLAALAHTAVTAPTPGARARADAALREQVRLLVSSWVPAAPGAGLGFHDTLAARADRSATPRVVPEPERVIAMSLETGAIGTAVWGPVSDVLRAGRLPELLAMLKRADPDARATREISNQLATPQRLRELLQRDPIDLNAADLLIAEMGVSAGRVLLDELIESKNRVARRALLDRLRRMGRVVGPLVAERLTDRRWFVQRNMLALLKEVGYQPENVQLAPYLSHTDARVRREALQVAMLGGAEREEAIRSALEDADPQIVRLALVGAREKAPESVIPVVVRRLADPTFPSFLRVPAIRLLHRSRSAIALDALLRLVTGGRTLFGGARLAPKSPDMIAALAGLATSWTGERRAAALLRTAARSRDPEIRGAAADRTAGSES